tara:strand:+ start:132 stop:314 length:183 start_codon:yes stop_codon:yes gene_type:complete
MPREVIRMAITREDFEDYLEVQKSGMYNMLSPDAIMASGLDKNVYMEIISNYSELKEKFD